MKHSLAVVLFCAFSCAVYAELRISEIMQSNIDCVVDDSNEFPDSWVELYNDGGSAINLKDYQLGDGPKAKKACNLPDYTLAGHEYAIIYCDKDEDKGAWHTSFRLESGKDGAVYLFKNKEPIDSLVAIPKMPAPNISYGRTSGGDLGFFRNATPMNANAGAVYSNKKILPDPDFSEAGRVFTTSKTLYVTLSIPAGAPANTYIRYTVDGSEPNASHGTITDKAVSIRVDENKTIRAKLFCQDYLSPMARTESYLFLGHETDMPIISLVGDDKYWYDDKFGILVKGSYVDWQENYRFDWRRPVSFEFFEQTGEEAALHQLTETRVHGNASRGFDLKSLLIYANKRFGEKRLDYEFFPDQRPGTTDFKSIILHNAANDFDYLYFRDALMQRSVAFYRDIDWMGWRPAIVFINGKYKGILAIRDRSNEDNIYTYYDGLEDITMVENWGELKSGDWNHWSEFKTFMATPGHTWEEYEQMIDIEEFMNYEIMELFFNNVDWPGNNIVWWRPIDAETGYKPVWRVLAKDLDYAFGIYGMPADYNMWEYMYNNNYDPEHSWANQPEFTAFFRYAMGNEKYKETFIKKTLIYLGDFLRADRVKEHLNEMVDVIQPEYSSYHRPIYNQWWPNYDDEYNMALNWLNHRHEPFVKQMGERYRLGTPAMMTLTFEDAENATIIFNGEELTEAYWSGWWFANREIDVEVTWADGAQTQVRKMITDGDLPLTMEVNKPGAGLWNKEQGQRTKDNRKIWGENGVVMVVNGKAINALGQEL